ncbi:MAG: CHASE2 domain-containing protein [Mariprofundaceae bacterium]|nr:CHASE2 domain-containing protein [Mariprofundaceae bacterium]
MNFSSSNQLSLKWINLIFFIGLCVASFISLLSYSNVGLLEKLDNIFLDQFIQQTASGEKAKNTLTIDIDDVSLTAVGQWPWPRYRTASLVKDILAMNPSSVGLDILFSEPDRTAIIHIQRTLQQDFGLKVEFSGIPKALTDNDGYLGYVLSDPRVVGAKYFFFDHQNIIDVIKAPAFKIDDQTKDMLDLHDAPGVLNNTYKIFSQLKFTGFLNSQPDNDGMLRKLPLLIQYKGVIHPHLSLAVFMRSQNLHTASIESSTYGPVIHVGKYRIPITPKGFAFLRFNGVPSLYASISAMDILNGIVKPSEIKGKTIFIGSSATGLKDLYHTTFDSQFPGVKTHSVVVENILSQTFIITPTWSTKAVIVSVFATAIIISCLFTTLNVVSLFSIGSMLWSLLILGFSLYFFQSEGVFLSPASAILTAIALFSFFATTRFVIERRHAVKWLKQLENARQVTMESMAAVAESRDPETGAHIKRTQHYVKVIAQHLVKTKHFIDTLVPQYIDLLYSSAPLHDIGKVGVPDHILMKPGKLTDEEFVEMKKHAEFGKRIIFSTAEKIEGNNFLLLAGEIAASHHEKWNGSGYPEGLAGENIPLSGRIMAVADVYDALISKRCYKPAFSHEKACRILKEGRDKHFDPIILDAFFEIEDDIKAIADSFQDPDELIVGDL